MFLRARLINKGNIYNFYKPRYRCVEIVTNNPIKFCDWCWSKGHFFYISRNPGMCEVFDENFFLVKQYCHSDRYDEFIKLIEKKWGFYDPHYDKLDWISRLVYNVKYYMGTFHNPIDDFII